MPAALSPNEIFQHLTALNAVLDRPWSLRDDALTKTFEFRDFAQTFAVMTRVAAAAEAMNHHPDWTQNFKRLHVELSTHDVGGLTEKDFRLAAEVERCASEA
ncbi:MAG TPA: 4a-hydroxytetrahydrobiopterin dehydratase [Candidatus Krumholzibacteria bacterium]|nr:4a-hydroxytetrahydrobiopterin dehydratase [Candidatus Krumholzibacteria bacterium]HRX52202.1 4a-hydroxytetrahydrobiopterin dehydratase [Candidatus Krumholzibacteria bacterium]